MALGNDSESDLLKLLFQNVNWSGIGDAGGLQGSSTAGSFYISLHTAALSGSSTQSSNEATYTGYARVGVARSAAQWSISGASPTSVTNINAITFGACTAGSETVSYFAVGRDSVGAGQILFYGALTSPLSVSAGITPQFAPSALTCTML